MDSIIIIGVIVSIIFYELTNISPGGIIIPGLMVLYINQVDRIIYTVIVAVITCLIVKFISRYLIIFGKRRFALMIIIGVLLNFLLELLLHSFSINLLSISIIGYTVTGIIANEMYKQGYKRTISSLAIVVGFLELLLILMKNLGV